MTADNYEQCEWAVIRAGETWLREKGAEALPETSPILKPSFWPILKLNPLSFLKKKGKCVWSKETPWESSETRNEMMMIKREEAFFFSVPSQKHFYAPKSVKSVGIPVQAPKDPCYLG